MSSSLFTRFVEIGRVAQINSGADQGKLVVVVDILDQNRALVDGAGSGVVRGIVNFKRLAITDLKVGIQRGARSKTVEKLFKEADIAAKWGKTAWAKRTEARAKRVSMNDFDRFKAMLAKKHRNAVINAEAKKLSKAQSKK
eukprot:TRINITY_DN1083_c2_g1_i1.p1 TRINITY_DN1083_c2_g1~~TRINITY_DN1083_c2_g1_i1.p1  ORF type:complete len:148 (-),score=56.77 TRINITY_DN1083_c2_g1_i1:201-623(-)